MKLKSTSIALLTAVFLSAYLAPSNAATIAGTACAKVGTTKTVSGAKYSCVKSGKKLLWKADPVASTSPSPKSSVSASPSQSQSATPAASTAAGMIQLTLEEVKKHDSGTSCWSIVSGNVFDLTKWIPLHPGGSAVIRAICGKDGTSAFESQHAGQGRPASQLSKYFIGKFGASVKL
jgi:cytochrome b involved in lipid metabolism